MLKAAIVAIASVTAPESHSLRFWQRVGFSIVGVIPDAEGIGQPGIHLAKRVAVPCKQSQESR